MSHAQVRVWNNSDCSKELNTNVAKEQVCAGGELGKSACNGDSGGGLFIRKEAKEEAVEVKVKKAPWYLFGIVSFGVPNCQIAKPEVYVR